MTLIGAFEHGFKSDQAPSMEMASAALCPGREHRSEYAALLSRFLRKA